jgi:endonuclease-3
MKTANQPAARRVGPILRALKKEYPAVTTALEWRTPLELLVATILSAQSTDDRVNLVTKSLFKTYRAAADYARADRRELETAIKSTGFFRNKAKAVQEAAARLVEAHGGEVPADMEALLTLSGVARKTANVVLGTAFGIAAGVVVDTHVKRVAQRLGLTAQADPVKIERDLMALLPQKEWIDFSHRVIWHGRRVCKARTPRCPACCVRKHCPYPDGARG